MIVYRASVGDQFVLSSDKLPVNGGTSQWRQVGIVDSLYSFLAFCLV